MAPTLAQNTWEYMAFTYRAWQPDETWCSLDSPDKFTAPQARSFFWEKAEPRISAEIEKLSALGWEPADYIGPDSIQVRKAQKIDFPVDLPDVFFWFITLGIGLLIHLILNTPRRYSVYIPVELRLRLRRPVPHSETVNIAAPSGLAPLSKVERGWG